MRDQLKLPLLVQSHTNEDDNTFVTSLITVIIIICFFILNDKSCERMTVSIK